MRGAAIAAALVSAALMVLWAAGSTPPEVPEGLPPVVWPADNPYSPAKAELGRDLFFDPRLSADSTVSCATCHDPHHGFTDGAAVSTGIRGQKGRRSAPTVLNRAYSLAQFWDGRAASLEEQARFPMTDPLEMGNTHAAIVARLAGIAGYRALFTSAFGAAGVDIDRVALAITCFERTLVSGDAPYDRYKRGDSTALSAEQVRGMAVFFNQASCDHCHQGSSFTLNVYANTGVGMNRPDPDLGRYQITHDPRDWGAFKVPTLREVEHTAPYMHDGSVATLAEVVDFYDKGGIPNRNLDSTIRPLHLSDRQKSDLVAFLKSLSGQGWQTVESPRAFPQ